MFFSKPVHIFPNKIIGKKVIRSENGFKKVRIPVTLASQFLVNTLLQRENMWGGEVFNVDLVLTWDWSACFLFTSCSKRSLNISSLLCSGSRSSKTFKPKKNIPEGSHQYELLKHAEATLGSGNLRMAVMLPEGEDLNEWVAVNSESLAFSLS